MVLLLHIILLLFPQNEIQVVVENITTPSGKIMVAFYASKENFMDETEMFQSKLIDVNSTDDLEFTLSLPPGTYAIALFHDVNNDDVMNKNFFGVPKEPYGFSNNAQGTMGAPSFESASFNVSGQTPQKIQLRSFL